MELRRELRAWLEAHVTPEVVEAGRRPVTDETLETLRAWNRELADARWAAPTWPVEHGGRDAGLDEQVAYHEEMAAAGAPGPINAIGVANIAPAIMAYGSAEQQERFLRPLLRGDEIWSQGCRSPTRGRTWPRCAPGPSPTGPASSSTARRPGTASATSPTGASSTCGLIPTPRGTEGSAELAVDVLGLGALSGEWAYNLASSPSTSIAGGTSEINRNIVAEQGLGLPRG